MLYNIYNMTIQEKIKEDMKSAMKAREEVKLSVLRSLISAFTNESITLGNKPNEPLSDENALKVINRASKQRKDSIEQFEKGGRPELAESEAEELKVIEEYLPEMMSEEEITKVVEDKKAELGINSPEQFGQLIGAVMGELKGKADGGIVKKIVEESLK
jgi:uncharacterized protein YqeY